MNGLAIAILSLGVVAGLAILAVAIWMMRTETQPKETAPQTESTAPVVEAAPTANAAQVMDAAPAPPPETAPPASPPDYPQVVSPPPPPSMPTAPSMPESTPNWLTSLASNATAAAPAPAIPSADEELLRLWRAPGGELIVEVAGQRYRSRYEVKDDAVTRRIMNALGDLNYFVNSKTTGAVNATPPPAPAADAPPAKPPAEERPVVLMSREEAARQPITVPTMDIMAQFRYLRAQEKKPQIKIK
ncbi:MAG: hypothetical protein AAB382_11435, partial [Chloroflexota bacterium]